MRRVELGEFLRSRRVRLDHRAVGFAGSARRRSPGLRREELASLAGVTVSWLAKLEQGRAQSVSFEVLDSLARALRLDDVERQHLFALAGLRPDRDEASTFTVTPALRVLLAELDPNPAYVLDRFWNIAAWNDAEANLFPGLLEHTGDEPPNLLALTFGDQRLASLMADHEAELARLVSQFRVHHTEWPSEELDELVNQLRRDSSRFAKLWDAKDVAVFESTRRLFDHPKAGRLEFDHHRFAVLDQPGAQLVIYTSADGTDSAQRLADAQPSAA